MTDASHRLPNYHQPNLGYEDLRGIAVHEAFGGEYRVGFHYLGRAMLDTSFVLEETYVKKISLRSFSKIIKANFDDWLRITTEATHDEKQQTLIRMRSCRKHPRRLLDIICEECRHDERTLETLGRAVDEMKRLVQSVCREPAPQFSLALFGELENLFDLESRFQ